MTKTTLAALAVVLIPSLATAQLVITESSPFGVSPVHYYDIASATATPTLPAGLTFSSAAADEAGGVLYLYDHNTQNLSRWPYSDPAPTVVGPLLDTWIGSGTPQYIAFGNGKLYVMLAHFPCGRSILEVDPAAPGAETSIVLPGAPLGGVHPGGYGPIAFDPVGGKIVFYSRNLGFGCPPQMTEGFYTISPAGGAPTFLHPGPLPPVSAGETGMTVGDGKLWFAGTNLANLDLTTLSWDPAPPVNPVTPAFFAAGAGIAWSPTLAQASASVAYCTAGTSASGCAAALSTTGTPSASASSGFTLDASGVEGLKDGLFFFGTNGRQANSWGSGTSYQCVVPPVIRAGLLTSTGTVGQCDGSFSQDLNALWCAACPKPLKNPGAGAVMQAQLWYRDPMNSSNQTTSLSHAVEFTVQP